MEMSSSCNSTRTSTSSTSTSLSVSVKDSLQKRDEDCSSIIKHHDDDGEFQYLLDNEKKNENGETSEFHEMSGGPNSYYSANNAAPAEPVAKRAPANEDFQKQIQQDWANREYIEVISGSIKRIADFLNSFDLSCRYRLAQLNEKLTNLERKIEVLEAWISKGETLP